MTFYLIGLGLSDEKDISVKGLDIIKKCDFIYMEYYSGIMQAPLENFEKFYNKKIMLANRDLVEQSEEIVDKALSNNVAFLVMGDPMFATTHIDIILRARKKNIKVAIVHNASILNAVGQTGLQLYKFGKITSMPFPEKSFNPVTSFEVMKQNKILGLHTLLLLDLRPDEKRFMTVKQAIEILLGIADQRSDPIFSSDTLCVGCSRLGSDTAVIRAGTAAKLLSEDFGNPPYCLIVPGEMHFMEEEFLSALMKS